MSTMFKYRVHEVAKDFKIPTKKINEILTKYATTPKNHMHILSVRELDIIFEYLTINNQIGSIEEVFAIAAPPEAPVAKTDTEKTSDKPAADKTATTQPGTSVTEAAPVETARKPQKKIDKPYMPHKAPQKRVVDTSGATINMSKYDERLDNLVPEHAERMSRGKEKIVRKGRTPQQTIAHGAKRRQEERDRMHRLQLEVAKKATLKVMIPEEISVGELASRMKKTGTEVVRQLVKMGVMASVSDIIDHDTAALVAIELGCKVEMEVVVTIEERLIDDSIDTDEDLVTRAPVVVVMGHVDHGKTSLLDRIRKESVATGEAGGITQHIGAYQTSIHGNSITFLDTPGHEAFTAMRARGASVTDIAILIVAADDGIMPQTIESINHAKAADIPIIVAINKIDKVGANPEKIKQQLTEYELVPEEWGGETIVCEISAKSGEGIDHLLEMIIITAEMGELRANPNRLARGTVIEARLDKGRGPLMTVLVQNGTLRQGDTIIAGTAVGNVRVMMTDAGERIEAAGPSVPVEISGVSEVPDAGDLFNVVTDERMAKELADQRKTEKRGMASTVVKVSLEDLFTRIQQGELKDLNIIVKADVQGSAEAIKASLGKLTNEEVRVRVIHSGVGAINESDIMLASTSGAIIVGFNVRPDNAANDSALRNNVDMRMYRVIYDCINEIELAMKGMLAPKFHEVVYGSAEVRELYKSSAIGTICGSYVQSGKILRNASARVVRDGIVVHEGEISSLRRFKDDVREVATNYECGIALEKFDDIKLGDIIECFAMEEIPHD